MRFNPRAPKSKKAGSESARGGCPACDGDWRTIQFDWKLSLSEPTRAPGHYSQTLLKRESLKRGSLYECSACGQVWYLDSRQEMMTVVPEEKISLLARWGSGPQILSESLWTQARAIGATPAHLKSLEKNYAEVPCRGITLQDESFDKGLIIFSLESPLALEAGKILLASDLLDIQPSDFALPAALRRASALSIESKAGVAPTPVQSPDGKTFLLNWTVNFFDRDGLFGKDLRTASSPSKRAPIVAEPLAKMTFILADGSPRISELLGP
ncbi:MAG: hypothetical protein ACREL1_08025 [bacterium]